MMILFASLSNDNTPSKAYYTPFILKAEAFTVQHISRPISELN
jgi:hypothetical protein